MSKEPPTRRATKAEKSVCVTCRKPIAETDAAVFRHAAFGAPAYGVTGLRSHAGCAGYRFNLNNSRTS